MALTVAEPPSSSLSDSASSALKDPSPPDTVITPAGQWPPPYFLRDGLRRVAPYHYTYTTNVKERWRGRGILDVFQDEFRDRPVEYYKTAMETGAIQVNGKPITSVEMILKNGDVITHTQHRHEPPVTPDEVGVVHEDEDLIVINKPAGVPVHPAGRYFYNCITNIMKAERDAGWDPLPCNRLDRLTSGIMFIGKHRAAAEAMTVQLTSRTVRKEYVARVVGKFPDGDVVCTQPILQVSPKYGLNRVRANGKSAQTVFKRLAYYPFRESPNLSNPSTLAESSNEHEQDPARAALVSRFRQGYSIVRCRPLTGRTHQLRVHLQFLGHPISNDPIYCNANVFGVDLGKGSDTADDDEDIMSRLARMGKSEVASAVAYHDEMVSEYHRRKAEKMTGEKCEVCQTELYSDPGEHELGIYLHALKYASADGSWSYETNLPKWALPPDGVAGPMTATAESDTLAVDLEKLGIQEAKDGKDVGPQSK